MEQTLYTFSVAHTKHTRRDAMNLIATELRWSGAIGYEGQVEGFSVLEQKGYWRGEYERGYTVTLVGPRDEVYRASVVLAVQNIVADLGEDSAILYEQHLPYESVAVYAHTTGPALGVQVEPSPVLTVEDPLGRQAHKGYPGEVVAIRP